MTAKLSNPTNEQELRAEVKQIGGRAMTDSTHCPGCCTQVGCIGSQLHIHAGGTMTDNTQSGSDINVTSKHPLTEVEAHSIKDTQAEQSAKIAHTTQAELDHIADVHEMVVDNSLDEIFDKMGYPKNTDFRKEAIRLITDWHNKQVEAKLVHISEYAENVTSVDEDSEFRMKAVPLSLIAVEINKLKESK